MYSLLLAIHITALSLSLVATVSMTIMALLSHASPIIARRTNLFITSFGIVLGGLLLIQVPLGVRCVELTAYLIIFTLAYRFVSERSAKLALEKSPA